ncbi:hypothetical protein ACOSQ3_027835 [Xanthoceras sorbifolium]
MFIVLGGNPPTAIQTMHQHLALEGGRVYNPSRRKTNPNPGDQSLPDMNIENQSNQQGGVQPDPPPAWQGYPQYSTHLKRYY